MLQASADAVTRKHVVFQVANQSYAIPIAGVEEIIPIAELTRSPGAPAILAGLLDVAGQFVPVVSCRRLWGLPDRQAALFTPLILLKASCERIALEVDSVECVAELGKQDIMPMNAASCFNQCVQAAARWNGTTVLLLSPERVMLEQEKRRLTELAEAEQQRLQSLEEAAL